VPASRKTGKKVRIFGKEQESNNVSYLMGDATESIHITGGGRLRSSIPSRRVQFVRFISFCFAIYRSHSCVGWAQELQKLEDSKVTDFCYSIVIY
jgi:hypothetical protein